MNWYKESQDVNIEDAEMEVVPEMRTRRDIVEDAKKHGLPRTGPTVKMENLLRIVNTPHQQWTREDFSTIIPYLSIHQDIRGGSKDRVDSIKSRGLDSGMVDSFSNMVKGTSWTWAGSFKGDAYLFLSGKLKYRSKSDPHLGSGNVPIAHISTDVPIKRGDFEGFYQVVVNS